MTGPRGWLTLLLMAAAATAGLAAPATARAEWLMLCDRESPLTTTQQDRLYRLAALAKAELAQLGDGAAIVARSGLDLSRFGLRYSHAGLALREDESGQDAVSENEGHAASPAWSVRQLYYACKDGMPKLFDQGMAGFLLGTGPADEAYVSVLLLPGESGAALARLARDKGAALGLLGARYSADAYPFSTRYQNCNQWVAEMLAGAWAPLAFEDEADGRDDGDEPTGVARRRAQAQSWLQARAYEPTMVEAGMLLWAAPLVPFVHLDDHPRGELAAGRLSVSMPDAITAFVARVVPDAQRVELCHAGGRVVVHRGWDPIAPGCVPAEGDTVITLD